MAHLKRHAPYARREGVEHNGVNANAYLYSFIEIEQLNDGGDAGRKAMLKGSSARGTPATSSITEAARRKRKPSLKSARPAAAPMLSPLISLHQTVHTGSPSRPVHRGAVLRLQENSSTTEPVLGDEGLQTLAILKREGVFDQFRIG